MIFSQRYHRALKEQRLSVVIPADARAKLATNLEEFDDTYRISRNPNNSSYTVNWSHGEEAISQLKRAYGWEKLPKPIRQEAEGWGVDFPAVIKRSKDTVVILDLIEIFLTVLDREKREDCRVRVNGIFDRSGCAWRISDGEFFKLDADFIGLRLAADAHDSLLANSFAGAADEFAKAREELAAGEVKDAILHAGKSFESVMKVMTGNNDATAAVLAKKLLELKFFDDLPDDVRVGFTDKVMTTLAFLRNNLGGHGQGKAIVEVSPVYGVLAIQLAAAFHNFLISKHLERMPPKVVNGAAMASSALADDCPF